MSLLVKITLPIAVAIAAIWGYLNYAHPIETAPAPQIAEAVQPTSTPAAVAPTPAEQLSARGTTDTALDADLQDIDAQLKAASQSSAAIDAGLTDQAGNTTY